jgi:hypothetical protein
VSATWVVTCGRQGRAHRKAQRTYDEDARLVRIPLSCLIKQFSVKVILLSFARSSYYSVIFTPSKSTRWLLDEHVRSPGLDCFCELPTSLFVQVQINF